MAVPEDIIKELEGWAKTDLYPDTRDTPTIPQQDRRDNLLWALNIAKAGVVLYESWPRGFDLTDEEHELRAAVIARGREDGNGNDEAE